MRNRFKDCMFFGVTVVAVFMLASGLVAEDKVSKKDVKSAAVELPDNLKELSVMESKLKAESRDVSGQLFKVLSDIRREKYKVLKSDPEIKVLNSKIAKLQEEVEKLILGKSKEISKWTEKREKLMAQDNNLRKELIAVESKKASLLDKSKTNINK